MQDSVTAIAVLNKMFDTYYQRFKNGDYTKAQIDAVDDFFLETVDTIIKEEFDELPLQGEKNVSENDIREQGNREHRELREPEPNVLNLGGSGEGEDRLEGDREPNQHIEGAD